MLVTVRSTRSSSSDGNRIATRHLLRGGPSPFRIRDEEYSLSDGTLSLAPQSARSCVQATLVVSLPVLFARSNLDIVVYEPFVFGSHMFDACMERTGALLFCGK